MKDGKPGPATPKHIVLPYGTVRARYGPCGMD